MEKKFLALGGIGGTIAAIYFGVTFSSYISCGELGKDLVRGTSMEPLIKNGSEITAIYGYYDCNEIKRGDVVLFRLNGYENPLIKRVLAIPGDKFELRKEGENNWKIFINGEVLRNSKDIPYILPDAKQKMLALYEKEFAGILPENLYLVFGDEIQGTVDSIKFGPIDGKSFIAKVAKY